MTQLPLTKKPFFSGSLRRQKRSVNHWDIHAMHFCSTIACMNQNLILLNSVHGFVIVVVYCDYIFKFFLVISETIFYYSYCILYISGKINLYIESWYVQLICFLGELNNL